MSYVMSHFRETGDAAGRYQAKLLDPNNPRDFDLYAPYYLKQNNYDLGDIEAHREDIEDYLENPPARFSLIKDGKMVGSLSLYPRLNKSCDVVYGLDDEIQGQFLMPLLFSVAIRYANDHGFNTMVAEIDVKNEQSKKTARRAGFRFKEKDEFSGDQLYVLDLRKFREGGLPKFFAYAPRL